MFLGNETLLMGTGIAQIWSDKDWIVISGYAAGFTISPPITTLIWTLKWLWRL